MSYLCVENVSDKPKETEKPKKIRKNEIKPVHSEKKKENGSTNSYLNFVNVDEKKSNPETLVTECETLTASANDSSILPTFTFKVNDQIFRGLKDSGCQSNLISESLLCKTSYKILNSDIILKVNGINQAKSYKTCRVEVEIVLGNEVHVIDALCLPAGKIDINLNIPRLKFVVSEFRKKNYKFADTLLSEIENDKISNVDLILGSKSGYIRPKSDVIFGPSKKALFSKTPAGIFLKGNIENLINEMSFLPEYVSSQTKYAEVSVLRTHCNFACDNLISENSKETSIIDVFDANNEIVESEIEKATNDVLNKYCNYYTHIDCANYNDVSNETNDQLVIHVLKNTKRDGDGRLIMPLLWNSNSAHLLAKNQNLSIAILNSLKKKLNTEKLFEMDEVFKEQEKMGIIERVPDFENFQSYNPSHSFLPFMPVFRETAKSTKCRVVFLSNLCEKSKNVLPVSHNMAMYSGPALNHKMMTSLINLRFGKNLCCFDVKKAFNNIALYPQDRNRLLFYWYRNIKKNDFELVVWKNSRLPFGLRCSPTILTLGLYEILISNSEYDPPQIRDLKNEIYHLTYVDNCAFSAESFESLYIKYMNLRPFFDPYHFSLQQFVSNNRKLQGIIDENVAESTPEINKLFGLNWDRINDKIFTQDINFDISAKTKRSILSNVASHFDIFNLNIPVLNRSRLFLHELQRMADLGWDENLNETLQNTWKNIAKQANSSVPYKFDRCFGNSNNSYSLIACCDSSKHFYGVVCYIKNLDTNRIFILAAKNRIVNKQLENKSIPALELNGIALATEFILGLYKEFTGESNVNKIDIIELQIFSDSFVALTWLNNYVIKYDKMQKKSTFIMNRISNIVKLCETFPVKFAFLPGTENPGDYITRCVSYKQLMKTNFYETKFDVSAELICFSVPNPASNKIHINEFTLKCETHLAPAVVIEWLEHLIPLSHYSDFSKLARVYRWIFKFIDRLKSKFGLKNPNSKLSKEKFPEGFNFYSHAINYIIKTEQNIHFPNIFKYFKIGGRIKDIPPIVLQLNLFVDKTGILRVKSKCETLTLIYPHFNFPILLPNKSELTTLIINDIHMKCCHAGCYTVLKELRKQFWVPHGFSIVKKVLRDCIICRRHNNRAVKINQNAYTTSRIDPINIPYAEIFIDYLGPYSVKFNEVKTKVYILCLTCMWSRAINLKVCMDMSTREFLRAFQLHCYEYGIPQTCTSDLGTNIVAGSNIITDFLKDNLTQNYFEEMGVKPITFSQFFKGRSQLGSMVEICVKMTKRLIYGAIKNYVLTFRDFEFVVYKTIHLVNRRPIAFKESLRDNSLDIPEVITPENLIRGYNVVSINVIPELHTQIVDEKEWSNVPEKVVNINSKLQKVRQNLIDLYNSEFLTTLIIQSVDRKNRYKPVSHDKLGIGDLVLLKETFTKPCDFPMARVTETFENSLGEITGVKVKKGNTGEIVKRHTTSVIPLMRVENSESPVVTQNDSSVSECQVDTVMVPDRPSRTAARDSREKTRQLFERDDA